MCAEARLLIDSGQSCGVAFICKSIQKNIDVNWQMFTKICENCQNILPYNPNCVKINQVRPQKKAVTALYRSFFGYTYTIRASVEECFGKEKGGIRCSEEEMRLFTNAGACIR